MDAAINIEENIGKPVGRRTAPNPLEFSATQIAEAEQWRSALGGVGVRKGVYRFKTHEEANASWISEVLRSKSLEKR